MKLLLRYGDMMLNRLLLACFFTSLLVMSANGMHEDKFPQSPEGRIACWDTSGSPGEEVPYVRRDHSGNGVVNDNEERQQHEMSRCGSWLLICKCIGTILGVLCCECPCMVCCEDVHEYQRPMPR